MDTKERIDARYLAITAVIAAAGIAFAFWQNSVYNAAQRVNAYTPGAEDPSRVLLVVGLLVVAAAIAWTVVTWRRKLRLLEGPSQGGVAVEKSQDQAA